jgi:transcriptional regulator with XRE-family HTH domain
MTTLQEMLSQLPPAEREAIAERTKELIAEELTLRDVRKALNFTQEQIARSLNVKQANISQMETRADLLLSTLRSYVEAMNGELELLVRFKDRPAVKLQGLAALKEPEAEAAAISKTPPRRKRALASA